MLLCKVFPSPLANGCYLLPVFLLPLFSVIFRLISEPNRRLQIPKRTVLDVVNCLVSCRRPFIFRNRLPAVCASIFPARACAPVPVSPLRSCRNFWFFRTVISEKMPFLIDFQPQQKHNMYPVWKRTSKEPRWKNFCLVSSQTTPNPSHQECVYPTEFAPSPSPIPVPSVCPPRARNDCDRPYPLRFFCPFLSEPPYESVLLPS